MEVTGSPGPDEIPHDIGGLLRITQIAGRIGALDEREQAHHGEHDTKLSNLFKLYHGQRNAINEQRQLLAAFDGMPGQVRDLATRVAELAGLSAGEDGQDDEEPFWLPKPTLMWWEEFAGLPPERRDQLLADRRERLQDVISWVSDIFRPGYGYIAEALPGCWAQHPLLVHVLDTAAEAWRYLYMNPTRGWGTLQNQLELQTRWLPALRLQFEAEGKNCTDVMCARAPKDTRDGNRQA